MINVRTALPCLLLASALFWLPSIPASASPFWVTGYFPAWQNDLTPREVDFHSLTHLIYFSLCPKPDGGLDQSTNGVSDAVARELAARAHVAGKKVLICIGGEGTGDAFRRASGEPARDILVRNLAGWVRAHRFDGVDVDFEPLKAADAPAYQAFIRALRERLGPNLLITAAVECQGSPETFAPIADDFDQINLMTYDFAGRWSDETWYDSPLTNDNRVMGDSGPLSATDKFVDLWDRVVPPSKLGIGICCEGRVWHGADAVGQPRNHNRVETLSYAKIVTRYWSPDRYHWDPATHESFLLVSGASPADNLLVVYDDPRTCGDKVDYAARQGLGGVFLWELSEDYLPSMRAEARQPLLSATWKSGESPLTRRVNSRELDNGGAQWYHCHVNSRENLLRVHR